MLKIGLTGGIGSGKSTVSSILKRKNIPLVDADIIAREVLSSYPDIMRKIEEAFGKEFIDEKGMLRRREFGSYIFKDDRRRKILENIVIPFIKKEIFLRFKEYDLKGEKIVVLDAPTLIENDLHKEMDVNILVWVDRNTQIQRVKKRDNLCDEEALNRINSQMDLEEKRNLVDYIIDNGGDLECTKVQIDKIFEHFI